MTGDGHGVIRVTGARQNNLRDLTLEIPKRQLTVFTGVSGSGKSSLVFGTIAAESQRLINETYSAYAQMHLPRLDRPDVDALENLSAAIVVDQERIGTNARSTLGTATDVNAMLRLVFSRLGQPQVGAAFQFSFNTPEGSCAKCTGLGQISDLDLDELLDRRRSLVDGAITVPGYSADGWYVRTFTESGLVRGDIRVSDLSEEELHNLLYREPTKVPIQGLNVTYEGLIPKVRRTILTKDRTAVKPHIAAFIDRAVITRTCPDCGGTRLNETARSSRINGVNIADACLMQISDLAHFVRELHAPELTPLIAGLLQTLDSLIDIGLGYLSLDRSSGSLSGGEAQRVKMVRHLGSALTELTYVFDEPTVGLHPHDVARMNELLLQLRDTGNTVLVVEHKPETIAIADHVIDLGPGAGSAGGSLQFQGTVTDLKTSGTLTGRYLDHRARLKPDVRVRSGTLPIRRADAHNLRDVDVDLPLGVLTVVTGVAGSGKSSLLKSLPRGTGVVRIDQSSIRGSRRSTPATYTGLMHVIRSAYATANDVRPALFSPNLEGACQHCNGAGVISTDLAMMAGVTTTCDRCSGKRFQPAVLEYTLYGKDISETLTMPVDEALQFFAATARAREILERLSLVGLGYVRLGQPLTTLSGGERQRLKLAVRLAEPGTIYVLDELTTGLHLADVQHLLGLLDRLVDSGKTVIVIEHHQAVMAHADWVIDVGPGAGSDGGRIVFEGRPRDLVESADTLTARHLRTYLGHAAEYGRGHVEPRTRLRAAQSSSR